MVFKVKAFKGLGFFGITADYHEKSGHINDLLPRLYGVLAALLFTAPAFLFTVNR
ncbi:MAG: hypothetical protein HQL09_01615 [Nitrospirae bacterium]|nr:hypothetical protein [Nitrospirota bacterium]